MLAKVYLPTFHLQWSERGRLRRRRSRRCLSCHWKWCWWWCRSIVVHTDIFGYIFSGSCLFWSDRGSFWQPHQPHDQPAELRTDRILDVTELRTDRLLDIMELRTDRLLDFVIYNIDTATLRNFANAKVWFVQLLTFLTSFVLHVMILVCFQSIRSTALYIIIWDFRLLLGPFLSNDFLGSNNLSVGLRK